MLCDVEAIIYDFRCAPAITSHQPLYIEDEELSRWIMVSYGSADKIYILKTKRKIAKTTTKTARALWRRFNGNSMLGSREGHEIDYFTCILLNYACVNKTISTKSLIESSIS